ncbi:MAG: putative damage-inducible protein DinB [Rhodothermales bacterium]|jgi:uncharacterized damage-inducible protein DinB
MDFRDEAVSSFEVAEGKMNGLAEVFSAEQYTWRPGAGVRSVEEVMRHVAGTNYWMMTQVGCEVPAETGFTADYSSVVEFEAQTGREEAIAILAASFQHLKACVKGVSDEQLNADVNMFGTPGTGLGYLMFTSTHLHEHLGQAVGYARVNGVVPPWSS